MTVGRNFEDPARRQARDRLQVRGGRTPNRGRRERPVRLQIGAPGVPRGLSRAGSIPDHPQWVRRRQEAQHPVRGQPRHLSRRRSSPPSPTWSRAGRSTPTRRRSCGRWAAPRRRPPASMSGRAYGESTTADGGTTGGAAGGAAIAGRTSDDRPRRQCLAGVLLRAKAVRRALAALTAIAAIRLRPCGAPCDSAERRGAQHPPGRNRPRNPEEDRRCEPR